MGMVEVDREVVILAGPRTPFGTFGARSRPGDGAGWWKSLTSRSKSIEYQLREEAWT